MTKIITILLCSVLLTACGIFEKRYEEVKVPVYMVPEPPTIERPELPIHNINIRISDITSSESNKNMIGELVQAYVISIRLLMNWGEANAKIVNTYRQMSKEDFTVDPVAFTSSVSRSIADDRGEVALLSSSMTSGRPVLDVDRSDFGTLKVYANQQFNSIIDKYEEDMQRILDESNEADPTEEPRTRNESGF